MDVQRSPPRSNAMTVPSYGNRQTDFSSSYRSDSGNFSPPRGDTNSTSLLNKDFCEVMDTGTMEDVAYLLEACGPKPEV